MPPASDHDERPPIGDLGSAGPDRPEPVARAAHPTGHAPTATPNLDLVLPAVWVTPSVARDRLRAWLGSHRWSPAHIDELVIAVSEAVSNSIEHGYLIAPDDATIHRPEYGTGPAGPGRRDGHEAGFVGLAGRDGDEMGFAGLGDGAECGAVDGLRDEPVVELHGGVTRDVDGSRRVELTVRDHGRWIARPTPTRGRGQGLVMMRACTDDVMIDGTSTGTTVVLRSRPLPPLLHTR